jgi:molybdate transport system ATP-binding protein
MTAHLPLTPEPDAAAKVGVLLYDTSVEVDAILTSAVEQLRGCGATVGGLLQRFGEQLPNGKYRMWVDDIITGQSIRLDKPRGAGASACILDPDALAQAGCMLRRITEAPPDLIIVNRFGRAEANGGGMRPEIADAIYSGAAVLISARFTYLEALEGFLGAPPTVLPPSAAAIARWAEHAIANGQPRNAN